MFIEPADQQTRQAPEERHGNEARPERMAETTCRCHAAPLGLEMGWWRGVL